MTFSLPLLRRVSIAIATAVLVVGPTLVARRLLDPGLDGRFPHMLFLLPLVPLALVGDWLAAVMALALGAVAAAAPSGASDLNAARAPADLILYGCVGGAWIVLSCRQRRDRDAALNSATRLRENQRELDDQRERLQRAEQTIRRQKREMEDFVSMLAHDLRHPVVSMQGLLSIVRENLEPHLDADSREHLHLTLTECERMKEIIAQISFISHIEHEPVCARSVNLRGIVDAALGAFHDRIAEKEITVCVECPSRAALIPAAQVRQALEHLLRNAIQHGCPGPGGHIAVRGTMGGTWLDLTVADNGPGIPARYHQRIFEVFRRLEPEGQVPAAGVGLTIVERLMRHIGGSVRLESDSGQGARFKLRIPVQPEPCGPASDRPPGTPAARLTPA